MPRFFSAFIFFFENCHELIWSKIFSRKKEKEKDNKERCGLGNLSPE